MKALLVYFLITFHLSAQAPAEQKPEDQWISFYKNVIALDTANTQLAKEKNDMLELEFSVLAKKVDTSLNDLVKSKQLVAEDITFTPSKLSKDQHDLMRYMNIGLIQRYGQQASFEMLDVGLHMRAITKVMPDTPVFKTRLPKKFNLALKHILTGDNLTKVDFPKPQTLDQVTTPAQAWIRFYKELTTANEQYNILNTTKNANPLDITTALYGLEVTLEKLTTLGVLKKKTYPFTHGQLSDIQANEYRSLVESLDTHRYGSSAMQEMAGTGITHLTKAKLAPAIKAKAITFSTLKNKTLTIYLPQPQFEQATKLLDSFKVQ